MVCVSVSRVWLAFRVTLRRWTRLYPVRTPKLRTQRCRKPGSGTRLQLKLMFGHVVLRLFVWVLGVQMKPSLWL